MTKSVQTIANRKSLPALPREAEEIINGVESGEILGASRTIRLLNDVFCMLADSTYAGTGPDLVSQIREWADYLMATRGALSPAVGNAIRTVLGGIEELASQGSVEDVQMFVQTRRDEFNSASLENVAKIAAYGANLIPEGATVMAYDYSSTVTAVLKQAAHEGKKLHVVIPESRSLNGGAPILEEVLGWGHQATFTVDAAIGNELRSCSSVLVGVESLCADGGFWNTVGTCSLAILAKHYHKNFLVVTELIKFDTRSIQGIPRNIVRQQLEELFDMGDIGKSHPSVRFECDDLEYTSRELISVYITETGVLPPEALTVLLRDKYPARQ